MYRRLALICHYFPGITPWTVWNLTVGEWALFAAQADAWAKKGD